MRVWLVVVVLMLNQFQTIILRCTHAYCVAQRMSPLDMHRHTRKYPVEIIIMNAIKLEPFDYRREIDSAIPSKHSHA